MPGFNQTGPAGQGPMTGRRMGQCANNRANDQQFSFRRRVQNSDETFNAEQSNERSQGGFGFGRGQRGRGRGIGRQNRFRGRV